MRSVRLVVASALLILGVNGVAAAQRSGATVGVVGGLNLAQLSSDEASIGVENRLDFMLGLSLSLSRSTTFAFQPELLYTRKGQGIGIEFSDEDGDYSLDADLILSYIELPLLAKFSFPNQGRVVPHLIVGPALSINVGCTVKAEIRASTSEGSFNQSFSSDCEAADEETSEVAEVETLDLGLVAGGGLTFGNFSVGVRYNLGLRSIDGSNDASDVRNRVLSFTLGYALSGPR